MIELQNVALTFHKGTEHEHILFEGFSLVIKQGEFVIVMGDNGAGKSTLMSLISGGVVPQKGKILIASKDVTKQNEHVRAKQIARVFQDPKVGTVPDMTVRENLSIAFNKANRYSLRRGVNKANDKYFMEVLSELGLGLEEFLDKKTGNLSGGQRQALSLIMAMITKPRLLLLDEHIAALDPETAKIILAKTDFIIKDNEQTAIMITHNIPAAMKYGSRLIFMRNGKVMFDISGEEKEKLTAENIVDMFKKV